MRSNLQSRVPVVTRKPTRPEIGQARARAKCLEVLFAIIVITSQAQAAVYHVAPHGNDAAAGTAFAPWRTLHKAATFAVAGDTVIVHAGRYAERLVPANDGAVGMPIVFAAADGEEVIIDGSDVYLQSWTGLVSVHSRRHLIIRGFRVMHAGPNLESAGIFVQGSDQIRIESCSTYDTKSSGIGVWSSSNVYVVFNDVELATNGGTQECITVAGTKVFGVWGNHVHNGGTTTQGGEGIDVKQGSSNGTVAGNHVEHVGSVGIYVDAWDQHTHDITVHGNLVHHVESHGIAVASEYGGLLENVIIYNNVVYDNRFVGIAIPDWGLPVASHPIDEVWIYNNTIHNNGNEWGGGIWISNPDATDINVVNNIFSQNWYFQMAVESAGSNLWIANNLIDGHRNHPDETWGDSPLIGKPYFLSISPRNLELRPESPAIDAAIAVAVPADDFRGMARPVGKGYDIGAYEYRPLVRRLDGAARRIAVGEGTERGLPICTVEPF